MKITKSDLYNALIEARVLRTQSVREEFRSRQIGKTLSRKTIREKIAAYRLLSNLAEIDARTYTHSQRDLVRVKKALAK
jgi:hypothetical protein